MIRAFAYPRAGSSADLFDDLRHQRCRDLRRSGAVGMKSLVPAVLSRVGDAADRKERDTIHIADMGNTRRFHINRQR